MARSICAAGPAHPTVSPGRPPLVMGGGPRGARAAAYPAGPCLPGRGPAGARGRCPGARRSAAPRRGLAAPGRPPTTRLTPDAAALLEDAARSLQLALERETSERAHRESAALRRSQELQREFLSRLSHELRTPLTAIHGYADSLLQPDVTWDPESQTRFLRRITTESARLSRLVGDLLDLSAIDANILRLQRDWCDVGLIVDAARACLPLDVIDRVTVDCGELPVVWADHDRLEQVLVNLMDNAVRHNPPGTAVRVTATGSGADCDDPHVTITVADDGIGVPDELGSGAVPVGRRRRARGWACRSPARSSTPTAARCVWNGRRAARPGR